MKSAFRFFLVIVNRVYEVPSIVSNSFLDCTNLTGASMFDNSLRIELILSHSSLDNSLKSCFAIISTDLCKLLNSSENIFRFLYTRKSVNRLAISFTYFSLEILAPTVASKYLSLQN